MVTNRCQGRGKLDFLEPAFRGGPFPLLPKQEKRGKPLSSPRFFPNLKLTTKNRQLGQSAGTAFLPMIASTSNPHPFATLGPYAGSVL